MIGGVSLLILIVWERKFIKNNRVLKLVPGALIVVLAGTFINEYLKAAAGGDALEAKHLVALPVATDIKSFFSFFTSPDFRFLNNPQVWITAFTLAIVASLETLLGIEAVDKLDPLKRVTPPNRELKAQGIGNIVSGINRRASTDFRGGAQLCQCIVRCQDQGIRYFTRPVPSFVCNVHPIYS